MNDWPTLTTALLLLLYSSKKVYGKKKFVCFSCTCVEIFSLFAVLKSSSSTGNFFILYSSLCVQLMSLICKHKESFRWHPCSSLTVCKQRGSQRRSFSLKILESIDDGGGNVDDDDNVPNVYSVQFIFAKQKWSDFLPSFDFDFSF